MSAPPGRGLWRRRARPAPRRGSDVCRVQDALGVVQREEGHERRDQPRPAGLVARADAGPDVAVEVLVEEDVIAPQHICRGIGPSRSATLYSVRDARYEGA